MKNISFTSNWNGKLRNQIFTTIRKHKGGEDYYGPKVGSIYNVFLRNDCVASGRLLEAPLKPFREIPELVLMLDTGTTSKEEALKIFEGFYGKFSEEDLFYVLVFEKPSKGDSHAQP